MRLFLLLSLLFATSLVQAAEEEIYVQLSSEVELLPIFVSTVENADSTLPIGYSESIRQVFLFDVNHNGVTRALLPKEVATLPVSSSACQTRAKPRLPQ